MTSQPLFHHPVCLLGRLDFHVQEQFTKVLAPLHLQPRQFGLLSLLTGSDGQSQQQLCESLDVHRNVMVGLVDELEQRELVERRRHPGDRRAHAVHLLPAGRALQAQAEQLLDELESELLGGLDRDEVRTLISLLQRVSRDAGLDLIPHPGLTAGAPAAGR
ncbi:MarR family winged helix-turn-helix transcriptional regulator [Nocardia sp. BMG111209]|uniref:MarR family winged helix-turn-helix transcriptional regulator n=1 Tax=Nocardia sp. BMG111209 TaxID=1160137 RepID=UPI00037548E5|nr:MarR family transcriptional regulator [Nocardia sp. BMG111209]